MQALPGGNKISVWSIDGFVDISLSGRDSRKYFVHLYVLLASIWKYGKPRLLGFRILSKAVCWYAMWQLPCNILSFTNGSSQCLRPAKRPQTWSSDFCRHPKVFEQRIGRRSSYLGPRGEYADVVTISGYSQRSRCYQLGFVRSHRKLAVEVAMLWCLRKGRNSGCYWLKCDSQYFVFKSANMDVNLYPLIEKLPYS